MPVKPVRVHSENVNSYGYRILTSGMDWSNFDTNPIMLYNHLRNTDSWDKNPIIFPIGKWNNRQMNGGEIVMTPEFDEEDDYGKQAMRKWEKGYLNTASIHVRVVAVSEDPALMLPGQTRPTITKCVVKEVSIVDIPGNPTCHKLTFEDGSTLQLDGEQEPDDLDKVLPRISKLSNKSEMDKTNLQLVAAAFGMPEDTDITKLVAKATELTNTNARLSDENKTLKTELDSLKAAQKTNKVTALIDGAVADGKLTAAQRDTWLKLAETDFDNAKAALDAMQAYKPLTAQMQKPDAGSSDSTLVDRFLELSKAGKLGSVSKEEKEMLMDAYAAHLKAKGVVKALS